MELGLTLTYPDLQAQVAYFLFGIDVPGNLGKSDQRNLDRVIANGLRRFYYPVQLDNAVHDWSFLRAKWTFKVDAETEDYRMPFDFGGGEGNLTHDSEDNVRVPVQKVPPERIMYLRGLNTLTTSWPRFYAERPVMSGGRESMRYEVLVWPTPNASYTLYGTYRVLPLAPSPSGQPFLYGGPEHSQTILEACLAQAELQLDGAPGAHTEEFLACLKTSIALDQSLHTPEHLGYNGDRRYRGKNPLMRDNMHFENFGSVTANGVAYTG